jgi:predicted PilT family ATPase
MLNISKIGILTPIRTKNSPTFFSPTLKINCFINEQKGGQVIESETVYLYIPNVAVGAIIGTKGSYIKNIIKLSGASVKITPLSPEESKTALERQVVIVGTPDSQWKAQYYIYEKIRQERFATDENVKLRVEIQVPAHIVGRIIGKSGKNVRELQRTTGATIKLPEDGANNQSQQQHSESSTNQQQQQQEQTQQQQQTEGEQQGDAAVAATVEIKHESGEGGEEAKVETSQGDTSQVEANSQEQEGGNGKQSPDASPNTSNANVAANQNGVGNGQNFVTGRLICVFWGGF